MLRPSAMAMASMRKVLAAPTMRRPFDGDVYTTKMGILEQFPWDERRVYGGGLDPD